MEITNSINSKLKRYSNNDKLTETETVYPKQKQTESET